MAAQTKRIPILSPGERADVHVARALGLPRSAARGLFDAGCVHVGEAPLKSPGAVLEPPAELVVDFEPGRRYRPKPPAWSSRTFELLHEDNDLLVVNKRAGCLSVPTDRREDNTLVHELARYVSRSRTIRQRVSIVHRLDRDTSGALVFGKTPEIASALKAQFAARKPERLYRAIVSGTLSSPSGSFRSFLETAPDLDQFSTSDPDRGKLAITHYRVLAAHPTATSVEVRLETGRRNQIRVHFAEAGHPVIGDVRYERARASHPLWREARLALHAATLGLVHPRTGESLRFEAPLPEIFDTFLSRVAAQKAPGRARGRA